MKKLYLVCYFNEMEGENDADVIVVDNKENQRNAFTVFFKETYGYKIKDKDITGIYLIADVWDSDKVKYKINIKKSF